MPLWHRRLSFFGHCLKVWSMETLEDLQRRYGGNGLMKFEQGRGGLSKITVSSDLGSAEIYLYGAHVAAFQPHGAAPLLFMSKRSVFDGHKPIRGGVPLVFPWFGPRADAPELPLHGFARTRVWDVESCDARANGSVRIVLTTSNDDGTMKVWPHTFTIRFIVVVSSVLDMTLEVRNLSREQVEFEEALHTYLAISDIRKISIEGLGGADFIDRADGEKRKKQDDGAIQITGETDRLYYSSASRVTVHDPEMNRSIFVEKSRSDATVVWNPWTEKATAMTDLGADLWQSMVCVETANARECKVRLPAGGIHRMGTRIGLEAIQK
jgi:glucose-6-phosphate 1-epimerase